MVREITSPEATIVWGRGRPESIAVKPDWQDRATPALLLEQVREQVRDNGSPSLFRLPRLSDIPEKDREDYVALLRDARREKIELGLSSTDIVRTSALEAIWVNGYLFDLVCNDEQWIVTAQQETLEKELVEACTPPIEELEPAQERLLDYVDEMEK